MESRWKRGEEKRRKKRTKRRVLKDDVSVLFLWRRLISSVKVETWRAVVVFLGGTFWRSRKTGLVLSLRLVLVVLDVTDVPVSPSSVVTEFCDGFSCCSDREYVEPESFSFSRKRARSSSYARTDEG